MLASLINALTVQLNYSSSQISNVVTLFEGGATVPFIARYRKEMTQGLDEVQILEIRDCWQKMLEADKRREAVIKNIEEQGKMTDELLKKLMAATTLQAIEDIYLPYKQKRKTKASIAIEKGLEPLAKLIFDQKEGNLEAKAKNYLNDKVNSIDEALQGARDIMAEWINENIDARNGIRKVFEREAIITAKVKKNKETEGVKYKDYFAFSEELKKIPSHRLLAIRRGEEEGFLSVDIAPTEENAIERLDRLFLKGLPEAKKQVEIAITDSYKRLIKPSIETEFDNLSKEKADIEAIKIFSQNLRQLLLSAPLGRKTVLAIDPGFRTGCKVVCLDNQGNLINDTVIYPHNGQNEQQKAIETLKHLVEKFKIEAIAIGNGTAGRESEDLVRKIQFTRNLEIFMVSEQGASIYSASEIAREEFPDKDITVRGSVSIGRRLMDPLAELVKIDPKSIGVGQYQHDVEQKMLKNSLDAVVESCVNNVGVDLNTASKHLLSYVSGLSASIAQNIVNYRKENGDFKNREQLRKVPRLGEKAFEQSAGFLRIANGTNPLDNSAVHPERYGLIEKMAKDLGTNLTQLLKESTIRKGINLTNYVNKEVGLPTLKDILSELEKPSRDPRESIKVFEFDPNIRTIEDLKEGMELNGIVTNITAFGCFVDVGVKQDGLLHVSQMANRYIADPNQVVKLQQQLRLKVVEVDIQRKRIALTLKF